MWETVGLMMRQKKSKSSFYFHFIFEDHTSSTLNGSGQAAWKDSKVVSEKCTLSEELLLYSSWLTHEEQLSSVFFSVKFNHGGLK